MIPLSKSDADVFPVIKSYERAVPKPEKQSAFSSFWLYACGVMGLFIVHSAVAEEIVLKIRGEGYKLGWFISFLTALAQFTLAALYRLVRQTYPKEFKVEHFAIGTFTCMAQGIGNTAAMYINFNTHQMFKGSKVVFVILTSRLLLSKKFKRKTIFLGVLLTFGLAVYSYAEIWESQSPSRRVLVTEDDSATAHLRASQNRLEVVQQHVIDNVPPPTVFQKQSKKKHQRVNNPILGIPLLVFALSLTAIGNVVQQAVLQHRSLTIPCKSRNNFIPDPAPSSKAKASETKEDLLFFTNLVTTLLLLCACFINGELSVGIIFFANSPWSIWMKQLLCLVMVSYGQRLVLAISQEYSATSATIILTIRKTISFILSIMLFPKPFNAFHFIGLVLIMVSAFFLQTSLDEKKHQGVNNKRNGLRPLPSSPQASKNAFVNFNSIRQEELYGRHNRRTSMLAK